MSEIFSVAVAMSWLPSGPAPAVAIALVLLGLRVGVLGFVAWLLWRA